MAGEQPPGRGARRRDLAPPRDTRRAADRRPEALRRLDPQRTRSPSASVPAGTGKTFLAVALAAAALSAQGGQPDHPHAPRGRGRRAPRLPSGRPDGQDRPVPAAAVRRAARHDRPREGLPAPRAGRDRGRAARIHARAHAQRLLRDPRRGAEHDTRADEDVPHAAGFRLEDGRHRRRDAGRPAARAAVGPGGRGETSSTASMASTSCRSAAQDVVRHRLVQRIVEAYEEHSVSAPRPRSLLPSRRAPV